MDTATLSGSRALRVRGAALDRSDLCAASGKTVLGGRIVDVVNASRPGTAVMVGLDGWHLTRAQLDAMPVRAPGFEHADRLECACVTSHPILLTA